MCARSWLVFVFVAMRVAMYSTVATVAWVRVVCPLVPVFVDMHPHGPAALAWVLAAVWTLTAVCAALTACILVREIVDSLIDDARSDAESMMGDR